jgi:Putative transposase
MASITMSIDSPDESMKVDGRAYRSLWREGPVVHVIDRTRLPHAFATLALRTMGEVADAIRHMVVLGLEMPWRDGTTHLEMSPLEFMQRLAALVPRPRLHRRPPGSTSRAARRPAADIRRVRSARTMVRARNVPNGRCHDAVEARRRW